MASSLEIKKPLKLKKFDGIGFDLWKERIEGILFLKECDLALEEDKPKDMSDEDWPRLNKKAITYIKMTVTDDILVGFGSSFCHVEKLRAPYENKTPINQVHLLRKLVNLQSDESKPASEHLCTFTGILSQFQDTSLPVFEDKLKAIFLLMTLPDSWETLVLSLSNSSTLTYDALS
ncbi:hypothetical protein L7F22_017589 [Adiantum nelumboides]|nr:hypothetical protein [Adiantum nelumboides]